MREKGKEEGKEKRKENKKPEHTLKSAEMEVAPKEKETKWISERKRKGRRERKKRKEEEKGRRERKKRKEKKGKGLRADFLMRGLHFR